MKSRSAWLSVLTAAFLLLGCKGGVSEPKPSPTVLPSTVIVFAPETSIQITPTLLIQARNVLQDRLNSRLEWGVETKVEGDHLQVELINPDETAKAIEVASGEKGEFIFFDSIDYMATGGNVPPGIDIVLTSDDIDRASAIYMEPQKEWSLSLMFTADGQAKLAEYTKANIGHYLVLARDGVIAFSPRVEEPLLYGAIISGIFDEQMATSYAMELNSGYLPFRLALVEIK